MDPCTSGRNDWAPIEMSDTIAVDGMSSGTRILPINSSYRFSHFSLVSFFFHQVFVWQGHTISHANNELEENCFWNVDCLTGLVFNQDGTSWANLDLETADVDDDFFLASQAEVHYIDENNNVSSPLKEADWRPLRGCFYRGQVHRDPGDSKAVLSLCHGLVRKTLFL